MLTERGPGFGCFEGKTHILPISIYYEDTDLSGIVYHANYLRYMERGRSEFFRAAGIVRLAQLEEPEPTAEEGADLLEHEPVRERALRREHGPRRLPRAREPGGLQRDRHPLGTLRGVVLARTDQRTCEGQFVLTRHAAQRPPMEDEENLQRVARILHRMGKRTKQGEVGVVIDGVFHRIRRFPLADAEESE